MQQASEGNTVLFHYTGRLADGTVFDSSSGRDPLQITLGEGQVVPGVDAALTGMTPGEAKTVTIAVDDAYGPHRAELIHEIDRGQIPAEVDLTVGNRLQGADASGRRLQLTVVEVGEATVKLDANHPLAGHELTFDLELVEIQAAA